MSPINLVHYSNALSGRAADPYAGVPFLHDSDAGHDMWSRSISRARRTWTATEYIGLKGRPMAAASKIAMQRAGRVVLALRWTAGSEHIGERRSAGHTGHRTRQGASTHSQLAQTLVRPRRRGSAGRGRFRVAMMREVKIDALGMVFQAGDRRGEVGDGSRD
jgi:hypothetical protein